MSGNRLLFVALSVVTAQLLQVTVLGRLGFLGARPNLLLVAICCFALVDGPAVGMGAGFAGGLLADLLSSHLLGMLALVLCLAGYAAGLFRSPSERLPTFRPMIVVGILSALASLAYAALGALLGDPRVDTEPLVRSLLLGSLYDVGLTPFVFAAVSVLSRRSEQSAQRL